MQKIPTKLPLPCGQDYKLHVTVCPWPIPSPAPCQAITDLHPDACLLLLSFSHVLCLFIYLVHVHTGAHTSAMAYVESL